MKHGYLFLLLLALTARAYSQNCHCADEMGFVIKYYEANLPGFKDNVTAQTQAQYDSLKNALLKAAAQSKQKADCFKLLTYYVEYFKDNHSGIEMLPEPVNEKDPQSLNAFLGSATFQSRETASFNEAVARRQPIDAIEGVYQTADSAYTIAVIPSKGPLRDYIGVIVASKTPLWKRGQVKIELKRKLANRFDVFTYRRNHSLMFYPAMEFSEGRLGNEWFKEGFQKKISYSINVTNNISFQEINDSVNYLRIPSFSGNLYATLDSVYKATSPKIMAKPQLIIDVRNNGGGSDRNVRPLLPYIYTRPFKDDVVDLYVTADNIKVWEQWYEKQSKDPGNFGKAYQEGFLATIERMKKAPLGSYLQRSSGQLTVQLKQVLKKPAQVAIIVNKNCASSCETLLFWAKESDKTILVGENSGGYVGYGEVGSVQTPCYQFILKCTMTRYREQRQFEVTGIVPDYRLDNNSDWIEQTIKILNGR
jgi:Peptidase family S41